MNKKWKTFEHNGLAFPPFYEHKNLTISINNKILNLTSDQEEMTYAWVKKRETPYVQDPVFIKNFLFDFLSCLNITHDLENVDDIQIQNFDFSEIIKFQEKENELKNNLEFKKQIRDERKKNRELLKTKYGYAKINGQVTEVANYLVEPPGIFMGRGEHPFRGKWKPKINKSEIILNLDKSSSIPEGYSKNQVVHDSNSMWIAKWVEKLTNKDKYVWLHDSADIRQQRDKNKFDYSNKLESQIQTIRSHILKNMQSTDINKKAIATTCFLIDRLAMRVGDEKNADEADTVGASTLRVEHVTIQNNCIKFDFLGKDSVRWQKTLNLDKSELFIKDIFQNLVKNKQSSDPIFESITSMKVNKFLSNIFPGLSGKVFRTYHASVEVKKFLISNTKKFNIEYEKIHLAKMANLHAAITCNHKKTPSKTWDQSFIKKQDRLDKLLNTTPKTEKSKAKLIERIKKQKLIIVFTKNSKEYNLSTSLKNYVDPRIYHSWCQHVDLDITKVYSKTLQRKINWVDNSKIKWKTLIKKTE